MKNRKRFRGTSIHWEITSIPRGVHAHLLVAMSGHSFLPGGDLPVRRYKAVRKTFIQAVLVARLNGRTHCCHPIAGYRRHEDQRRADFRPGDGCFISVCDFHAGIVLLPLCGWVRMELNSIAWGRSTLPPAHALAAGREGTERGLECWLSERSGSLLT